MAKLRKIQTSHGEVIPTVRLIDSRFVVVIDQNIEPSVSYYVGDNFIASLQKHVDEGRVFCLHMGIKWEMQPDQAVILLEDLKHIHSHLRTTVGKNREECIKHTVPKYNDCNNMKKETRKKFILFKQMERW